MKKIKFWQKHTGKNKIFEGWLVEEKETKFVVKCGEYKIEWHYPKAAYEYEIVEDQ